MNQDTAYLFYQLLIHQYLLYYRLGFQMLIEEELSELKGAEDSLKKLTLDHQLLIEAQHPNINIVGHLLDPLRKAIETLGNLNAFPDTQQMINDLPRNMPPARPEERDDSLLQDLIKHMPDYENKSTTDKLFIEFIASHGTFSVEVSDIVAQLISREAAEPITLDSPAWEDQTPLLRPHADSNDLILLDMLDEMNQIFKSFMKPSSQ